MSLDGEEGSQILELRADLNTFARNCQTIGLEIYKLKYHIYILHHAKAI